MKKNTIKAVFLMLVIVMGGLYGCRKDPAAQANEYVLQDPLLKCDGPAEDNARVFYEIFTGSFSDSNGDGTGDIRGIINRFDYLNDGDPNSGKSLGIEGIWLTPIFSSPSYHKYDVTDYYSIDPKFGTQADLDELIALCHTRDVKLILDLPINHTATDCEWFKRFTKAHQNNDPADPYYDFYSYYKKGETAPHGKFTLLSGTDIYYECNFSDQMPELNFDNPAVREEFFKIARYYLSRGIDGFRFDAAKYCYFDEHAENAEFWTEYLDTLRKDYPSLYTIAEVWDKDSVTNVYYPATNCFNFTTAENSGLFVETVQMGEADLLFDYIERYLKNISGTNPDAMFVPFISNHDMDRAAGYLSVDNGQMQMAANLYILGPGSPYIYYGEEIGMRGSRGSANTDANRRLAMLWGDNDTVKDPTGSTYPKENQTDSSAAAQLGNKDSLYNYYKKLIMIRKANPAIARGEYHAVTTRYSSVAGFTSTYNNKTVLVLHNVSQSSQTIDISQYGNFTSIRAYIGQSDASLSGNNLTLGAQTTVVME